MGRRQAALLEQEGGGVVTVTCAWRRFSPCDDQLKQILDAPVCQAQRCRIDSAVIAYSAPRDLDRSFNCTSNNEKCTNQRFGCRASKDGPILVSPKLACYFSKGREPNDALGQLVSFLPSCAHFYSIYMLSGCKDPHLFCLRRCR